MITSFCCNNYIELYNTVMEKKERKPNRLKNYDYSQNGAYFITICTNDRKPILSEIIVGATYSRPNINLTRYGIIVLNEIEKLNSVYDCVSVDNFVVMPNHIHLIIRIDNDDIGRLQVAPTQVAPTQVAPTQVAPAQVAPTQVAPTVSRIIKQFKMSITKQIGQSIWQKGFYDHIIRDDIDYMTKYQYIDGNPVRWAEDKYYL